MDSRGRRLPVGAECHGDAGVDFRVWAPKRGRVDVVLEDGPAGGTVQPCETQEDGYFRAWIAAARAGTLYRFRLDEEVLAPDPASRAQPAGPHGPSQVVDPTTFRWSDDSWNGPDDVAQVVYELHVGTFTPEGTWAAAAAQLAELAALGVTVVEMMPIGEFPGRFNWGYDAVDWFAPSHLYGTPDDLRRFVDAAHALKLAVVIDVVYNHFGPEGNYLPLYADTYAHKRPPTEWGPAVNFDGEGCSAVRELVTTNARYWIEEYRLDGLRVDATQDIADSSSEHILGLIASSVRAAAKPRRTYLVAENEPQSTRLVRPLEAGGHSFDAMWNDDLHHALRVALTGRSEAYYVDYGGTPQELISALKYGFLYQGQYYDWQKRNRGSPALDLSPRQLVTYIENHDQVANTAAGARIHGVNPSRHRALVTLLILGPSSVLLFQGEEFASTKPFVYFADHPADLARKVREGRQRFLSQFPSAAKDIAAVMPPPELQATFEACKLDLAERRLHAPTYRFYRDLLALRKQDAVVRATAKLDGAVLAPHALAVRFMGDESDRLIVVNLGPDLRLSPCPEPLLAPPAGGVWSPMFSSEDPRYGGGGAPPAQEAGRWTLLADAAVVLRSTVKK